MEKDVYELTNAQKSIWNTELFYNGSNINNICGTINIFEPLDINALKEALNLIIEENDNLHAQFYIKDGCIYQSFKKDLDYNIDVLEISSKTDLRKLERKMRSHIFDILHSDLFDFKIFKYPDSTGGVVVNIHHLISDSWTLGLIAKILSRNIIVFLIIFLWKPIKLLTSTILIMNKNIYQVINFKKIKNSGKTI